MKYLQYLLFCVFVTHASNCGSREDPASAGHASRER